ncbi:MAG: hypothetical protein WED33_01345 [Bacteroidia bacterium]
MNAIPQLEKTSGMKVGQPFIDVLKAGTQIQNSLIPAIALCVFKEMLPGKDVMIAHRIQSAQFVHGLDLHLEETYKILCKEWGISFDDFSSRFHSEEYKTKAEEEFEMASVWGIRGFPAVILNRGDMLLAISNGYTDLTSLEDNFSRAEKYTT